MNHNSNIVTATLDICGGSDAVEYVDNSYSSTAFGLNAYSTDSTFLILEDALQQYIQTNDFAVDSNQGFTIYMKYKLRDEQVQNVFDHYAVQAPVYQVTSSEDVIYTTTTNIQFAIFTLGDTNVSYSLTNATSSDFNGPSFSGTLSDVYTVLDYDLSITYNSASTVSLIVGTTTKTIPIVKTYILKVVNNLDGVSVFAMSTNDGLTYTNNKRESFSTGDFLLFDVSDTSNDGYVLKFGPDIDDSSTAIETSPYITRTNTPGTSNATVQLDLREYSGSALYYFETSNPDMGYIDTTKNLVSLTFDVSGGTDIVHYDDAINGATAHGLNIVDTSDNTFLILKNSVNALLSTNDFATDSSKGFTIYMKYKLRDEQVENVFDHYAVQNPHVTLSASHTDVSSGMTFSFTVFSIGTETTYEITGVTTDDINGAATTGTLTSVYNVLEYTATPNTSSDKTLTFTVNGTESQSLSFKGAPVSDYNLLGVSAELTVSGGTDFVDYDDVSYSSTVFNLNNNGTDSTFLIVEDGSGNYLETTDFAPVSNSNFTVGIKYRYAGNIVDKFFGHYAGHNPVTTISTNAETVGSGDKLEIVIISIGGSSSTTYEITGVISQDLSNAVLSGTLTGLYNVLEYDVTPVSVTQQLTITVNGNVSKTINFTSIDFDYSYTVTVAGGAFYLNGVERQSINFDPNKKYLFFQTDESNIGYPLAFGRLPDDNANILTEGITTYGTLGTSFSQTLLELPGTYKDSLFYFHATIDSMGPTLPYDTVKYVKVVQNSLAENVFAVSSSSNGIYYNQPDISFVAPNKYLFNVSDSTNTNYQLVFGTEVDNSGTVYSGTVYDENAEGTTGAFVYLDLTDYTGAALYMFDVSYGQMGYVSHLTTSNTYSTTIVDDYYLTLNGVETPSITFTAGETYVFLQDDTTNVSSELLFGRTLSEEPFYTDGISIMGTVGRPGSYLQLTLANDFTGDLFYFLRRTMRDDTYYVKIGTNYELETENMGSGVYTISDTVGGTYYNQRQLNLVAPNRYIFDVSDVSNSGYEMVFGTTVDDANTVNTSVISRVRTSGTTGSLVILDLSGYSGSTIYYFDSGNTKMGYTPVTGSYTNYVVKIVNNTVQLNDVSNALVGFTASNRYLFDQSDASNETNQLYLSRQPYLLDIPPYISGVTVHGTLGQPGAYTLVENLSTFSGNLYYLIDDYELPRDYTYYVKLDADKLDNTVFAISETFDGTYSKQPVLTFTAPNRYYFEYYFELDDPTSQINVHNYVLNFGEQVDDVTIYSGTVHKGGAPGTYRSAVYLDLSGYNGNPLVYYSTDLSGMGYKDPSTLTVDFSYNVTVSDNKYYLNGVEKQYIDFDASKTYLFLQGDSSNLGRSLIFGRAPDDYTILYRGYTTYMGEPGKTGAYTYLSLPADFQDSLFYFDDSVQNMGPIVQTDHVYYTKVVQNILNEYVYSVSTTANGNYYNQPDLSFNAPNKYYFDVSETSNTGYKVVFGTEVDNSGTVYSGTVYNGISEGSTGAFIILDLTDYTGGTLYMFDDTVQGMGYNTPTAVKNYARIGITSSTTVNTYDVSMSSDQLYIFVDNVEYPDITLEKDTTYVFYQNHSSNVDYQIVFGTTRHELPLYTTGVSVVGTLGQPGAYTMIAVPVDFTGDLFYFLKSTIRDITKFVSVKENYLDEQVFALSDTSNGIFYNQPELSFTAPNKYYFDVTDVSNTGFEMSFGTTIDDSSTVNNSVVTRGRTPGQNGSFVLLDLSGYTGSTLYYFETTRTKMGYYDTTTTVSYTVTISGDDQILLDGTENQTVLFETSKSYKFVQESETNADKQMFFSRTPYLLDILYTNDVSVIGTPGQNGAYTTITTAADFSQNLYYITADYTLPRDFTYYVKLSTDYFGNPVFSISKTGYYGTYYNQVDISLNAPNRYYFEYFFDMFDSNAHSHNYRMVFGETIDGTPYSSTVSKGTGIPGTYRSAEYVDLSTYSGNTLRYYSDVSNNMGFTVPETLQVDFSYNVTVVNEKFYLNGVEKLYIDFDASKSYLFVQSDSTNVGNQIVFGKLPDDMSQQYTIGKTVVGTLGQPESYTYLSLPSDFTDTLFYFHSTKSNMGSTVQNNVNYFIKVVQNALGHNAYAVSTTIDGTYYNQPDISFVAPNRYHLDVSETSNVDYKVVFGTVPDDNSSIYNGTVYSSETPGTTGSFVLLDLNDYTGDSLYLFDQTNADMGYVPPPSTPNTFTVTASVNQYYLTLDGVEFKDITFAANQQYVFLQDDSSNVDYQIMFGRTKHELPVDMTGVSIVGTLGQPGAYTILDLGSSFTGDLFYFLKSTIRETTYFMTTRDNYLGETVFAIADTSGGTYYNQPDFSFNAPNRYYFDVADVSNTSFKIVFGTEIDNSSTVNETVVVRGREPGQTNSFVYLDLSGYTGDTLYYFEDSSENMGHVQLSITDEIVHAVTVSTDNIFLLDGVHTKFIDFTVNKKYVFYQNDVTNVDNQLYFSREPFFFTEGFYTDNVTVVGEPGRSGAYTTIDIPADFSRNLYFLNNNNIVQRDVTYYVKLVDNVLGDSVFAISETGRYGTYIPQDNISIVAPNKYYFDLVDNSNSSVYNLYFGTTADDNTSINSSIVQYNETAGEKTAYTLLDLSSYAGAPLFYFNNLYKNTGYQSSPTDTDFVYNIIVSNNKFFLNGNETPEILFEAGKSYLFTQTDPTNEGFPLVVGKIPDTTVDIRSNGFVPIGQPGQPEAFSVLTLPDDFKGDLFYFTPETSSMGNPLVHDFLYYVRVVTNDLGLAVYAISSNSSGGPYYNQENLFFRRPNRYLFDISDTSMDGYQLTIGTQVDNNDTIHQDVTYGTHKVYLDLRDYFGGTLYYFNASQSQMGYLAPPGGVLPENTYTVTVFNDVFLLNGVERLDINFTPGVTYLFYQISSSNTGHQILFGRLPDDTANIVGDGITIVGTAGQPNAYTLIELPDTFNDALFYFSVSQSNMGNQVSPDVTHYVKVVENVLGQNVYAIASTEDGIYYNQPDISFVSPNKYILYVSHSTNDGYQIAFGTTVDDSSTIYSGTTYDEIAEGTTGSFVYLDLTDDPVGQPLYMFDISYAGMGYVPVPTTDNVYSVSMSIDQNHIFIDNILHPDITFTAGQTYVFTQDGSSNTNYEIVFGETKHKRPLFTESNKSVVGTLGRPGAYTAITMPSDFYDRSLFYFTKSYVSDILYQVKVETNALNEPLFSFSQTGRYLQQPNITFTAPNQYYFDMSDVSNNGYVLQFGTTTDDQSTVNESVVFRSSIVPGQPGSFIFLDLSGYTGAELKYFEQTTAKMGYIPPPVILDSNSFTVTISDETLLLDKSFTGFQASQIYLFDQSHPSNDGFGQIVFGTTEGSSLLYTTGVSLKGTPGLTGACSMIEIPADFTGSLFFYSLSTYTRDIKYYVDIVTVDGNANYGFATTQDGSYNTNVSDLLSTYNKYYFNTEALVDTSYNIVFGTIIDSISSVPSVVQGFNTFSYIDISTYSGSSLFYFDETISNMSETTSTVLSKLDNPSQAILNAPVPIQRSYTKNVVSEYLQKKPVSEKPIELTPQQLVGFTVHERVKSIMIADTTNTFAKRDLLEKAIYTTLGTLNESITVPTRSGSVTVKNIGDDQFEVRRTDTDTILTTASAGEDYTIDLLKLEFGTLYAELDLTVICFKRDSKILCMCDETYEDKYIPVQHLKRGTLVKTYKHGYVPVHSIGYSSIYNSGDMERKKDRLYKCDSSEYPELFEPLVVTGCHSILKDTIDNRTEHILRRENHGKLYCTDNKYRIMTYLDKKSKPYRKKGTFEIWHFALEHSDYYMNYGVYANGLLVETASKRMMTEIADMVYTG